MRTIYKAKVTFKFAHLLEVRDVTVDFDEGDEACKDDRLREIKFNSLDDLEHDKEMCSACTRVRSGRTACRSRAISCSWREP